MRRWTGPILLTGLAVVSGEEDLAQVASGNLGWAFFKLGDRDRALDLLIEARKRAAMLGDTWIECRWLVTMGYGLHGVRKTGLARTRIGRAFSIAIGRSTVREISTGDPDRSRSRLPLWRAIWPCSRRLRRSGSDPRPGRAAIAMTDPTCWPFNCKSGVARRQGCSRAVAARGGSCPREPGLDEVGVAACDWQISTRIPGRSRAR